MRIWSGRKECMDQVSLVLFIYSSKYLLRNSHKPNIGLRARTTVLNKTDPGLALAKLTKAPTGWMMEWTED